MSIDYSALGLITAFLSVLIAITALWLETRRSRLALQADVLLRLDERFYRPEMHVLRQTAARKLLTGKSSNPELSDVLDFFSTVAYMVEHGAIDLELTYAVFEYWIVRYWYCAEEYISEQRRFDPEGWSHLERLVKQMQRRTKRAQIYLSKELLHSFLQEEACYENSD